MTMEDNDRKVAQHYIRVILNILIPAVGTVLICTIGPKLLRFFMPFVVGWIVALIANPLVRFLESRLKVVRRHGSMLVVIGVLALIIGALYAVFSKLFTEASELARNLPEVWAYIQAEIRGVGDAIIRGLSFLPDPME